MTPLEEATGFRERQPRTPDRSCPLCGSSPGSRTDVTDPVVRCDDCGLVYRAWFADEAELDYWSQYTADTNEQVFDRQRETFYQELWRQICKLPKTNSARPAILDIGCVPGMTLNQALAHGWEAHGVETTAELCELTRRNCAAKIWQGYMEELDFAEQRFDLITIGDCFRHVQRPAQLLGNCAKVLKPGGALVIRDLDVTNARHSGRVARPWPWDLQFVSPRTATRFLQAAGFEDITTRSSPLSFLTLPYVPWLARSARPLYRIMVRSGSFAYSVLSVIRGRSVTPSFLTVGFRPKDPIRTTP